MSKFLIVFLSFFSMGFSGCEKNSIKYASGTLDEAFKQAKQEKKYLFVINESEGCEACGHLISQLEIDSELKSILSEDILVYKTKWNVESDKYLSQALYNIASPTSYIFDHKGRLVNMMAGVKSPKVIKELIENGKKNNVSADFKSRLNLSGAEFVKFSNLILEARHVCNDSSAKEEMLNKTISDLEESVNLKSYFFNNYLLAKPFQRLGKTEESKQYASRAMKYDNSFSKFLYQSMRNELRAILDRSYNEINEAKLSLEKKTADFGQISLGSKSQMTIKFKSTGKKSLILESVLGNCSCMEFEWTKSPLEYLKQGEIKISYSANQKGKFSKQLYVFSNSDNSPEIILLNGFVK